MCGISGIVGSGSKAKVMAMVAAQDHRGPDANGVFHSGLGTAALGHNRLSIIDLSDSGRQPMADPSGRFTIVFNGEIYNYLELRRELEHWHEFRTQTDTEVLLAAFIRSGPSCLDRLLGMFAFAIWDEREQCLFAARDRWGVKPFYYAEHDGALLFASEIKALHAAGLPAADDPVAWATYLALGLYEHSPRTFWRGVSSLSPGHTLTWRHGEVNIRRWYDLAEHVGPDYDSRPIDAVQEEYLAILADCVRLRFRADVPVGINLSGGLDSSILLGLVHAVQGEASDVAAFTFVTGDAQYDELPWVEQMLARTSHRHVACRLSAAEVPGLAESVHSTQDEPFAGLPTLAYARLFEHARRTGTIVLLDGQGLDEQWAGYDYYRGALAAADRAAQASETRASLVQGTSQSPVRPACLAADFRRLAEPFEPPRPFPDALRNLQYRDIRYTKIPRALRFNDRVSMRSSTELREPFLDHRLFELALRQPPDRKIRDGSGKWFLRQMAQRLVPPGVAEAPKRPLQTPQREWLRGPLADWAGCQIAAALEWRGGQWFEADEVKRQWAAFRAGETDNSFFVWQWVEAGLRANRAPLSSGTARRCALERISGEIS